MKDNVKNIHRSCTFIPRDRCTWKEANEPMDVVVFFFLLLSFRVLSTLYMCNLSISRSFSRSCSRSLLFFFLWSLRTLCLARIFFCFSLYFSFVFLFASSSSTTIRSLFIVRSRHAVILIYYYKTHKIKMKEEEKNMPYTLLLAQPLLPLLVPRYRIAANIKLSQQHREQWSTHIVCGVGL